MAAPGEQRRVGGTFGDDTTLADNNPGPRHSIRCAATPLLFATCCFLYYNYPQMTQPRPLSRSFGWRGRQRGPWLV